MYRGENNSTRSPLLGSPSFLLHVLNKNENIINVECWVLSEIAKINSSSRKNNLS